MYAAFDVFCALEHSVTQTLWISEQLNDDFLTCGKTQPCLVIDVFVGTRYKRRGVDEEGYTANYVETEQVYSVHWFSPVTIITSNEVAKKNVDWTLCGIMDISG